MPFNHRNLPPHIFSSLFIALAFSTMAVENIKYFTFKLNSLQFETIRNLFIHYDWDFDECIVGEKKSFDSVSNIDQQLENGHQSVHEMPSTIEMATDMMIIMMGMVMMAVMIVMMKMMMAVTLSLDADFVFCHLV